MLAAHGTQDARKEHAGKLCRGKSGRDNGRAALSALRPRPQGTLRVGHLPHLRQRARRRLGQHPASPYLHLWTNYLLSDWPEERVLTESEQQEIRDTFTNMGYDGSAIEFDRYEEQYPQLMRTYKLL